MKNKKYTQISSYLEFLDKKKIAKYITTTHKKLIQNIIILKRVTSTNTYLANLSKTKAKNIICLAESQSAGKGRLGRKWISPYARNIYLSILWNFKQKPNDLIGLNIAIATAIASALKAYGIKKNITLKWPNDVLWKKRKLAGVLIELGSKFNQTQAIIGVGLNVHMPIKLAKQIAQPWCDIAQIIKTKPRRNKLVGLLLNHLLDTIIAFQTKGLKSFLKKWKKLDIAYGKKVVLTTTQQQKITGIDCGIDERGFLLLKVGGKIQTFAAGEINIDNIPADIMIAKSCWLL